MDFLQRHLPRVYQAVQNALDYISNVTAQIFGAPPNAPQPRNARAKTPLRSEDTAGAAIHEDTAHSQADNHITLAPDALVEDTAVEATEESMEMYVTQQDNRGKETAVRHRKENVDRRPHHTDNEIKDTSSPHRRTMEKHEDQSHREAKKLEDVDDFPCSLLREVVDEVHVVINEEVQRVNQEALVNEKHTRIKTAENSSISSPKDRLKDLEPGQCQDLQVPPTGNTILKSDLDLKILENFCSTSNVIASLSLENIIIIHEEVSDKASIFHETPPEDGEKLPDVLTAPVIMEYDDLEVPEINRQQKKLVTPVSAADRSPCDQGEEARKTWEHLQETAERLALHSNLLQGDNQEFELFSSGEIPKTKHVDEMCSSDHDKQGDDGEGLEEMSRDPKEVIEQSFEDEEQSEEVRGLSRIEEDNQPDKQPGQTVEKARRRVHFSPSTEERDQIFCLTSEDLIQEGALEPTSENWGHSPSSHPRPQLNNEEDDFGTISSNQNTEASITKEERVDPPDTGHTIWYDEAKMTTDEEICKSIADVTEQNMTLNLQPEKNNIAVQDEMSPKVPSTDIPSIDEIQDNNKEPSSTNLEDISGHLHMDSEVEDHHEEGTESSEELDGNLETSFGVVSDRSSLDGSNCATHEVISMSLEDTEFYAQKDPGDGGSEDIDVNVGHHELCQPLLEANEESTKVCLTLTADELHGYTQAAVYIPDEGYNQTSVQDLDTFQNGQSQAKINILESEKCLSTDSRDLSMITKAKEIEDKTKNEYENVEDLREENHLSENVEEQHVCMREEHFMPQMEDYTWYRQDSYQSDGLITYSDSTEVHGSQEDPTETDKSSSEMFSYKHPESEAMSKVTQAREIGSDFTEPGNTCISSPEDAFGSNDGLNSTHSHPEMGFDLLVEIQSTINTGQSEQNISVTGWPEVIPDADSSKNIDILSSEGKFTTASSVRTDNVVRDLDLQCKMVPDLPLDNISEDLKIESQTSILQDEILTHQSLGETAGIKMPLDTGSLSVDVILDQNLEVNNISESREVNDVLCENHSMLSISHPVEVLEILSNVNVGLSDKEIEDAGHCNAEEITVILSEKTSADKPKTLEEISPDLQFSEELGSLIEPRQILNEEHHSSAALDATQPKTEVPHVDLDLSNTSPNKEEDEDKQIPEDPSSIPTDERLNSGQPLDNVSQLEISYDTKSVDTIEVVLDQNLEVNNNTEPQDEGDLLGELHSMMFMEDPPEVSEIVSTVDLAQSDTTIEDDTTEKILSEKITVEVHKYIVECSPEEPGSILELKQTFNEEYSSTGIATIGVSEDDLELNNRSLEVLKNKEKEDVIQEEEDQSSVYLDETFIGDLGDQPVDNVKELEDLVDTRSLDCIEVILEESFTVDNITEAQDRGDNLSDRYSVTSVDHPADDLEIPSTINVAQSDKGMEDEAYSDEDILSDATTLEERENLRDPWQTTKEEHYSSIEIGFTETKIELNETGLNIKDTIEEISENKEEDQRAEEDIMSADIEETSSGHLGDQPQDVGKELEITLDTQNIMGSVQDLYSKSPEVVGVLLSTVDPSANIIVSSINEEWSDNRIGDGGQSSIDTIVETVNVEHHEDNHQEELRSIIQPDQTPEEHDYSSFVAQTEAANDDSKKIEHFLSKDMDSFFETHHDLTSDHKEKISESNIEEESQSYKPVDNASRRQTDDLKVKDINVVLGFSSDLSESEGELSVKMMDHPSEIISLISSTGMEDISKTSKTCDILDDSSVQSDIPSNSIIPEEQEKIQGNISAISYPEEIGISLEPSQVLEESHLGLDIVNASKESVSVLLEDDQDREIDGLSETQSAITLDYPVDVTKSLTSVLVAVSDESTGEDILPKSTGTGEKGGPEDTIQELHPAKSNEQLEKKLHEQDPISETLGTHHTEETTIQSMAVTKQDGAEDGGDGHPSHEDALCMSPDTQVITIHREEPSKLLESPTHMEKSGDEPVSHEGTLLEPSMEEGDDNSLLPHNTLDVSAQKSRVQLRRKTSIRRKQGQRQVTSESEPIEPPQPVARPRTMGVPIFPGQMPIFTLGPTMMTPVEEQKEDKPANEELLVKPKKGIPKHAGFGIPPPQMMQELQARLKKKKPKE
ncbi:hypothetical protein GDO81_020231 [Engystomops pustulosus]|uniref:Uncharacterized protein n=1 Tax=Engystomops pustulosus TaxID=76066 RepID=A0AAV6Z8H1_ENGPU|nr:hypothetical protein GDO81_020231 [Engystomops pustulosus]